MNGTTSQIQVSDTELVVGGIATIVLVGVGTYLLFMYSNPPGQAVDTTTTLEDAAALATLAALA